LREEKRRKMRRRGEEMRTLYLWKNCFGIYKYFAREHATTQYYPPLTQGEESENKENNACVCMACFGGEERSNDNKGSEEK